MTDKTENKKQYVTLEDGIDYRTISKIMSNAGFQMNHATARNVFQTGISSLLTTIGNEIGSDFTPQQIEEILKDQDFHESFADILFLAYNEMSKELL